MMGMSQIPAAKTPLSAPQALSVLADALGADRRALPMVAAQSAVETNHWTAMWHWNFGNVSTADPATDYQILPSRPPNPIHFKVYSSPEQGARDYVAWLRKRGVLDYALRNDLAGYGAHLKSGGYLGFIGRTAPNGHVVSDKDYDDYMRGIAGLVHSFENMLPEPLRDVSVYARQKSLSAAKKAWPALALLGVALLVGLRK